MSIMDNARHLHESAGEVTNDAMGAATSAVEALDTVAAGMQQVKDVVENSTQTAAMLLGEGHPGVDVITGSAATVSEKVQSLHEQIQALRAEINTLDGVVLAHGDVMRTVANGAMGGS
jgi:ABC-type transporter Mla subunit MlaD